MYTNFSEKGTIKMMKVFADAVFSYLNLLLQEKLRIY